MSYIHSLSTLIEKLKSNSFLKNVLIIATGTAAGQAIGMLSAPVITRIYSPEDYGVFTTFMAILSVTGSFATMRYAVAIPISENDKLANNVLKLSFIVTFILSVLISLLVFIGGDFFLKQFSSKNLAPYIWLIPIAFLGKGIYDALNNWAIREKHFKTITRTKISQGLSGAGFKIGLGWLGVKPIGLLIGLLAQEIAGIGSLLLQLIKDEPTFFKKWNKNKILHAAKRFKDFPIYQSWSQLLLSLGPQLPVFFIASSYGAKTVGLFGLAHTMINMPMNLIGTSVAQVYFAEIAKYGKSQPDKILDLSISIIKKMFLIGLGPAIIIMIAGPSIFDMVFGTEWYHAGVIARILSVMILARFISTPIMHCLNVFELQKTQLILNIIRVSLICLIFSFCWYNNLSNTQTIIAYTVVVTLFYVSMALFIILLLKQKK